MSDFVHLPPQALFSAGGGRMFFFNGYQAERESLRSMSCIIGDEAISCGLGK